MERCCRSSISSSPSATGVPIDYGQEAVELGLGQRKVPDSIGFGGEDDEWLRQRMGHTVDGTWPSSIAPASRHGSLVWRG